MQEQSTLNKFEQFFYFHIFFKFLLYPTKRSISTTKVYITTVLSSVIYTPTCFNDLCYHQGVTDLLLAKLHKF
jgi:hypothetical protein